ncbi:FadR/GntR family transcriptional regulator [Microcella sp.]|uniref:FadR/GntR family transcriptional regulator n=1 Tax=Microcella sp. TaxID=1913979 RepID=UPI002567F206|nr:FCD domain-containing protein [Microcella sp.]MBX9472532.1 FCD domain-containing protein [Microcella sp.]
MVTEAPATRAQALAATIERTITEQGLQPGDALGTIESWRETSGFARASVSEALRLLVDRGLVEIRPGRGGGVFVARTGPVVRLRHTLISVHGEATTLADAIAIRESLEPLLVLDAARSRTAAHTRALRSKLAKLESALDDHDAFIRAVWVLHEQIAAITPNEMLRAIYLTMMHIISDRAEVAVSDANDTHLAEDYRQHRLAVHRELVDAIEAGDLERASRAVAAHSDEAGA